MGTNHRTYRLLVAAAVAGVGLAVAACDGGTAQSPQTETVTVAPEGQAEPPAADASPASGDTGSGNNAGSQVPADWPDADFPVPPGVNVTAREGADNIGIVLVGRSPEEVTAFYRSALPAAGYQITKDSSVGAGQLQVVGMEFTGHGYDGKLAVVNSTVSISIEG